MTTEYERHEFSYAWPEIPADHLGILVASMRTNGYDKSNPVTLYEGQILDGWNRYRAAVRADVEPAFTDFNGTERQALNFVEMRNSSRRQLTIGQQASALRKIDLQRPEAGRRSMEELAALLGSGSMSTVRKAFKLAEDAPEVADEVASGRKPFETAIREEVDSGATNTKTIQAMPSVSVKLLTRLDAAARLKSEHFKPITPNKAATEAFTLWAKAREQGKKLIIADY